MRLTTPFTAAGAVALAVTVAACTGGSGSAIPSVFTPSVSSSATVTPGTRAPSPSSGSSGRASASSKPTGTAKPTASKTPKITKSPAPASTPAHAHTAQPTYSAVPTARPYPTTAPETGGGGTAGLQDGLLFGVGGGAVLVGFGTLAYRRRLARKFAAANERERAAREPADR